jgi:uncharacterized protein (DUF952 family)
MRAMILHIVRRCEWEDAVRRGSYAPASLRGEGFIHCSTVAQVIDTANRFYRGQRDLIVLCIEESRLRAELKYEAPSRPHDVSRGAAPSPNLSREVKGEASERTGALFPHLYASLNLDAVVRVVELPCEEDGSFRLPEELRKEI